MFNLRRQRGSRIVRRSVVYPGGVPDEGMSKDVQLSSRLLVDCGQKWGIPIEQARITYFTV